MAARTEGQTKKGFGFYARIESPRAVPKAEQMNCEAPNPGSKRNKEGEGRRERAEGKGQREVPASVKKHSSGEEDAWGVY